MRGSLDGNSLRSKVAAQFEHEYIHVLGGCQSKEWDTSASNEIWKWIAQHATKFQANTMCNLTNN